MTIPGDALNREWVEQSGASARLVNQYRPALLALMAFGPGGEPGFAGSAFIIASGPDFALALTAKHVLLEGVKRLQQPHAHFALSSPFVPRERTHPSLSPKVLKASWMGPRTANLMNVWHIGYNDTLDIACILVGLQDQHAMRFRPTHIPIDTRVPAIGDVVQMVALADLSIDEINAPEDRSGSGQVLGIHRRVSVRLGVVTGLHPNGLRHYRWPCFTTSIPAEPGMSGGLVSLARDKETVAACGIVCADNSTEEARVNFNHKGDSIVGSTWPALALRAPIEIADNPRTSSLLEMMLSGTLQPAIGGVAHISMTNLGNGDLRMERK